MSGHAHTQRTVDRRVDGGAVAHRVQPPAGAHAQEVATAVPGDLSPRTQSLLQMAEALDESPAVQSQLALQRAMNRRPSVAAGAETTRDPSSPPPKNAGVEHLSGFSMDDVRVHYNSAKPATVQAHAYAQGTEIHVAPGQERHLPHEAWHVAQQKQGRVKPTLQAKGVAINDDAGLEREADVMGRKANVPIRQRKQASSSAVIGDRNMEVPPGAAAPVQRIIILNKVRFDAEDEKIPKIHGLSDDDVEFLKNEPRTYDTHYWEIDALKAEVQKRRQKEDKAAEDKKEAVRRLTDVKQHIAGEVKNEGVKGGHLLTLMQEVHGNDLNAQPTQGAGVWECNWTLRKRNQGEDQKAEYPKKKSTMFPSGWTWDNLVEELQGGTQLRTRYPVLRNGITIEHKGKGADKTFYPLLGGGKGGGGKDAKKK